MLVKAAESTSGSVGKDQPLPSAKRKGSSHRRLLTYDEAGEYLAVGRTTMYGLVSRGEVPAVKIGRCTRLRPEDLEDYIKKRLTRRKKC